MSATDPLSKPRLSMLRLHASRPVTLSGSRLHVQSLPVVLSFRRLTQSTFQIHDPVANEIMELTQRAYPYGWSYAFVCKTPMPNHVTHLTVEMYASDSHPTLSLVMDLVQTLSGKSDQIRLERIPLDPALLKHLPNIECRWIVTENDEGLLEAITLHLVTKTAVGEISG